MTWWLPIAVLAACLWTGVARAVTVAVIDSGADPIPDLAPALVPGFDYVDNDADTRDALGHGTNVSHIVWWSSGENATIMPIRVLDSSGFGERSDGVQALQFAIASPDVRVINMSLGSPAYFASEARALQDAVAAGKIIIMAAGNSSGGNPLFPAVHAGNLGGSAIAVGASDAAGNIRPYSNRAGSSLNAYLVAPDFPEANQAGTSFSAPVVSGAAVQVIVQAPHLSAQQVVAILLSTARDMGKPGVDEVYGHGALDLRAALMPAGEILIATEDTAQAGGVPLVHGAMRVSPALGLALVENGPQLGNVLVLDAYQRGYTTDLRTMIDVTRPEGRLAGRMAFLRRDGMSVSGSLPGGVSFTTQYLAADPFDTGYPGAPPRGTFDMVEREQPLAAPDVRVGFAGKAGAASWGLALNGDPRGALAPGGASGAASFGPAARRLLGAPWLSFGEEADLFTLAMPGSATAGPRLALASTEEPGRFGLDSRGLGVEIPVRVSGSVEVSLQLSTLVEHGGLLGGASNGAFSVEAARTLATTLRGTWRKSDDTQWLAAVTAGFTGATRGANGLLASTSPLTTLGFSTGVQVANVVRGGDQLTLSLTSPLRVENGEAVLRVGRSRDLEGGIDAVLEPVSLEPAGRELALEASWRTPLGINAGFGAWAAARHQPDHSATSSTALEALLVYETRF